MKIVKQIEIDTIVMVNTKYLPNRGTTKPLNVFRNFISRKLKI